MKKSTLLVRSLSAAVLIPLALGAIYVGGNLLFTLMALMLGLASFEFVRLMEREGNHPSLLLTWGFVSVGLFVARDPSGTWLRPALAGLLGGALVWQVFQSPRYQGEQVQRPAPTADWALTVTGGLYVGWMGGHVIALREGPDGFQWLLLPLLITWAADSGAYFVGSTWGRRKLAPYLSPGKTWEGTVGGWLTGIVAGGLVAGLLGLGVVHGLVLGVFIGVASPLGDLGISMIKRQVGVKDTSDLIPGHGGMLDRIDSILFTIVIGYYYVQWIVL
ncbi:MAG: phosphatidate cytidylyltransferase [Anaerolineae bacterium]|jgi:phosphatidate cytidylyltransferase